jgi:RAD51-like protein 3
VINNTSASTPHNLHSAFPTTVRKPALGPSFTFLTDGTLWLAKYAESGGDGKDGDGSTLHIAEVFKSKTTVRRKFSLIWTGN